MIMKYDKAFCDKHLLSLFWQRNVRQTNTTVGSTIRTSYIICGAQWQFPVFKNHLRISRWRQQIIKPSAEPLWGLDPCDCIGHVPRQRLIQGEINPSMVCCGREPFKVKTMPSAFSLQCFFRSWGKRQQQGNLESL